LQKANEISITNDLSLKEKLLKNICGSGATELKQLRQDVSWKGPTPANMSSWADFASQNNLEVLSKEDSLEIATREIEKRRSGHLPTIDLVGSYDNTTYSAALSSGIPRPGSDVVAATVGLQLRMPLYNGGLISAQVKEAIALREKALDELQNAKRNAISNAQQSFQDLVAGLAQISAYDAALSSSESALKANRRGYELGIRVNIDVLNAQSQVFDTKQKLLKARFDTLVSQLKLKASTGSLSENDLADINELLE
jgi:outer membrane protein